MSSQFSYELDERQIRIMMQDSESDYNESVWNKFDELSITQSRAAANVSNYMPKINLSISRSIIVPVIFIVLIGGLSAMLFSFVDFKKKESIDKEIPYIAKIEPVKQPKTPVKTIIKPKPVEAKVPQVDTTVKTISATPTASAAIILPPVTKKEEPVKITEAKPQDILASTAGEKKATPVVIKKKKTKVKITEVLPTISAPTNLNEGTAEPELELK
ncbi:MAG: hypothetical protein V4580_04160 [Bacteroidota bacterium]